MGVPQPNGGTLGSLQQLYLGNNLLDGSASLPTLGSLKSLLQLSLFGNKFKGTLSSSWVGQSLQLLDISQNYLNGAGSKRGSCQSLVWLSGCARAKKISPPSPADLEPGPVAQAPFRTSWGKAR